MFHNISITFLCALAFISWSLLCYLHAIEDQTHYGHKVKIFTVKPTYVAESKSCPNDSPEIHFLQITYDLIVNYGIILLVAIAISASAQWLVKTARHCIQNVPLSNFMSMEDLEYADQEEVEDEKQMEVEEAFSAEVPNKHDWKTEQKWQVEYKLKKAQWHMERQLEAEKKGAMKRNMEKKRYVEIEPNMERRQNWNLEEKTLAHQENIELREQLNDLQQHCRELLQELRAVNESSRSNSSSSCFSSSEADDPSSVLMWKQPATMSSSGLSIAQDTESLSSMAQKVYVTHSHYHFNFNGPVQLMRQNINLSTLGPQKLLGRSEFLQVWGTFLCGPKERPMLTGINNILM
ncbi:uncharacterized protein LOC108650833 [Drosophila navojoa]|uniref:uncharacterized protein LOC108650833 n=1 Tax=Drosophila navojoa TaxID=7232 RepID=UPI0008476FCB|nr:uncharacterized protein LOC108650833 [Drosophila navojoa]